LNTQVSALGSGSVILVLSASQNSARTVESHLRNAGHPVRAAWLTDLEDLDDALRRAAPDLVLCAQGLPNAPFGGVLALCAEIASDVPVLMLAEQTPGEQTVHALQLGARDCVSVQDDRSLTHLERICLRELQNHGHRQEIRRLRMQLADFEARHSNLVAGTADAIAQIQEGIVASANPAFAVLTGFDTQTELDGQPLMDLIAEPDRPRVKSHLRQLQKGKSAEDSLDLQLLHRDGTHRQVTAYVTKEEQSADSPIQILIRSGAGVSPEAAGPSDSRTQLFEALHAMNGKPNTGIAALMALRVDDADRLEERLGLVDADEVFATLRELVADLIHAQDKLFRTSAAEWTLMVANRKGLKVEAMAESIRKEVSSQLFRTARFEAHLTTTIVAYPLAEDSDLRLVNDEIVFEARRSAAQGSNRVLVLGPKAESEQAEKESQRQAGRIRRAIEERRLKLAYQSIASLEGDTLQYFDVFVRMIDETGQERLAREFLPAAEKHGLMKLIDRWVTSRSLSLLAKRAETHDRACLFVRLSEDTLRDAEGFLHWLHEQTKTRALGANELVFEVREGVVQNHIRKAKLLCAGLAELKADLAIDYFGAGANSAPLLGHVAARFVKFHPSFTQEFTDLTKQKRLKELLDVARQRNVKAIVSHVEDANVMARLWQMGINFIQGNSVQEPEVVLLSADVHVG